MIMHIVLFKWNDGVKDADIERVAMAVRKLDAIDGLTEPRFGPNGASRRTQGFTHCLTFRATPEALEIYKKHPLRDQLNDLTVPLRRDFIACDQTI